MHKRASRMLAVGLAAPVALTVLVATTAVPAHAETTVKNFCAYEPVIDGTTRIRACIQGTEGGETATVKPWARMRFASPKPQLWESCTVIVALFIDGQKRTDRNMGCLAWALTGTAESPEVETFSGWTTTVKPQTSYEGVTRWYGIYNGQAVGSHVNSHSPSINYGVLSTTDGVNLIESPELTLNPGSGTAAEEYLYEPAIPVEY